ncbi:ferrous iron transporter A [Candidatus Palibaumannia cicadellinicola]|uniref:Ferrous iron transport protein A n=1 Tax=Candidatus Palibaumannia cicadellinicola TaxID=186490 RepID=A0A088N9U6_9GAMM|nr:ferrous iron transporter A [Candidatus Baumannia cicadellinicola]AIN46898.1 Ferrous iron transport protein A [Candidatus Baumannia cicadellinicola]
MHLYLQHHYQIIGYAKEIPAIFLHKMFSLGMLPGSSFQVIRFAPLGDPVQIKLQRVQLILRQKDLALLLLNHTNN